MVLQQLYHGGQLELHDAEEGRFALIVRPHAPLDRGGVEVMLERPELVELISHLCERLKVRQPPGEILEIDRQGAAALDEAAARAKGSAVINPSQEGGDQ